MMITILIISLYEGRKLILLKLSIRLDFFPNIAWLYIKWVFQNAGKDWCMVNLLIEKHGNA